MPIDESADPEPLERCRLGFAALIEQLDELRMGRSEQARIASVAITQIQTAELWALKALTWRDA